MIKLMLMHAYMTPDIIQILRSKVYQQQVLQQKLQARKLDKKQEKERDFKNETAVEPYRPGSAKRYATDGKIYKYYRYMYMHCTQ